MKKKILAGLQFGCFLVMFGLCGTMDTNQDLPLMPFLVYYAITLLITWLSFEASKEKIKVVYVERPTPLTVERWNDWKDINCYAESEKNI